ncbi:MAG: HD-GYP domain-containing protein [Fimbriimonas sp.]
MSERLRLGLEELKMMGPDDAVTGARILLVDDDAEACKLIEHQLRHAGYHNLGILNGPEGVIDAYMRQRPDLLIIDYELPPTNGVAVLKILRPLDSKDAHPPVIMITGSGDESAKLTALEAGVADFLPKTFEPFELILRVRNVLKTHQLFLEVQRQKTWLEETVRQRIHELRLARREVYERLAGAIEYRDDATGKHTKRVGDLAARVAIELGSPPEFALHIATAALLHDLGKIGVSDAIILKKGKLTTAEREDMKQHSVLGAQMLSGSGEPILAMACEIALSHHEWWDGSGYPHGLRGTEIPLSGRIVAAVDAYDAMMSDRPYRNALPATTAIDELLSGRGTQFDPKVVDALLIVLRSEIDAAVAAQ